MIVLAAQIENDHLTLHLPHCWDSQTTMAV
jgi:hypothetical protein